MSPKYEILKLRHFVKALSFGYTEWMSSCTDVKALS